LLRIASALESTGEAAQPQKDQPPAAQHRRASEDRHRARHRSTTAAQSGPGGGRSANGWASNNIQLSNALIVCGGTIGTTSLVTLFSTEYIGTPIVPVEDAVAIEINAEWS
jgi:hypothetical protein